VYSSSQGCYTATGTHMPRGITQCYLPPGRGDISALTPAEAGSRLSDPGGMQGWVDQVGLLHTHPGTNRARRALTSFMQRTPLTTTPRRCMVVGQDADVPSRWQLIHRQLLVDSEVKSQNSWLWKHVSFIQRVDRCCWQLDYYYYTRLTASFPGQIQSFFVCLM